VTIPVEMQRFYMFMFSAFHCVYKVGEIDNTYKFEVASMLSSERHFVLEYSLSPGVTEVKYVELGDGIFGS